MNLLEKRGPGLALSYPRPHSSWSAGQPHVPGHPGYWRPRNEGTLPSVSERAKTEMAGGVRANAYMPASGLRREVSAGFREVVVLELSLE